MHRSKDRSASFAWRAYGLAQALCLPPGKSDMAGWSSNLCPVVRFSGDEGTHPERHRRLLNCKIKTFEGGFVTCGTVMEGVGVTIDEGASCTDQAVTHVAFAALPDSRTCLCIQYVVAAPDRTGYTAEVKDIHLVVPNDLFNGSRRVITTSSGQTELISPAQKNEVRSFEGKWLNIDDCLGVVILHGGDKLVVDRSVSRRGGRYKSIFAEEICMHSSNKVGRCEAGQILVDVGFAVVSAATAEYTKQVQGGSILLPQKDVRALWVIGADGKKYDLVANFGSAMEKVECLDKKVELSPSTAMLLYGCLS